MRARTSKAPSRWLCGTWPAKVYGLPLYRLLGGPYRKEIELAACMGIQTYERAGEIARLYVEMGFSTLKTKAGRAPEEDLAMVRGVRDAVGDQLELRIDPNTGYSPAVCEQLARDLEPYRLQYFEQPMHEDLIDDSARIRKRTTTPLALNESVTTLARVREILTKDAAAFLLPDTYQCGGVWATKLVAEVAASANVPCIVHCAHDLGPKTAAMLHLAASTPNFPLANDCTYYGLVDDVITHPFEIRRGGYRCRKRRDWGSRSIRQKSGGIRSTPRVEAWWWKTRRIFRSCRTVRHALQDFLLAGLEQAPLQVNVSQ